MPGGLWQTNFPPPGSLPPGAAVGQAIAGFPTGAGQQKENWCWAAVCSAILQVLPRPGRSSGQAAVVAHVQGPEAVAKDDMEDLGFALGRLGYAYRPLVGASLDPAAFDDSFRAPIGRGHPVAITIQWDKRQTGHAICAFGHGKLGGKVALLLYDPAVDDDPDNVTMVTLEGMRQYAAQLSSRPAYGAWRAAWVVGES